MSRALAWLSYVLAVAMLTHRAILAGGTTWHDHLMITAVLGCFAVYGVLGLGALSALRGWGLGLALLSLGVATGLLYPPFGALDVRVDHGAGPLWWLILASQPAYSFAFWAFLLVVPHSVWAMLRGRTPGWPGPWLLMPVALALWGLVWVLGAGDRVSEHQVQVAGLTGSLRVVHMTDIHFGPDLPEVQLRSQLDRVALLEPDIVVITGDLVDPYSDDPGEHDGLLAALGALTSPVVVCPGNRDTPHWGTFRRELEAVGLTVLDDQATVVRLRGVTLQILGTGFRWGKRRESIEALLAAHPPLELGGARLLVSHHPSMAALAPADSFDLALAGHTHGGTPAFGFLGWRVSAMRLTGMLDQGLFVPPGGPLYVNQGSWIVGFPPRIGTAPEIAVFDLLPGREPGAGS